MEELNKKINTIFLLMFENRSFDHLLGHLSQEGINKNVNGLKYPYTQYTNWYKGDPFKPYNLKNDQLPYDLPHEYNYVEKQLAWNENKKQFLMNGFVEAYIEATDSAPNKKIEPMGFFSSQDVPSSSFLAQNFCVCDNWFAPIPTSTQPNRTIAFTGSTEIFETKTGLISIEDSIFHWMDKNGISWRVYHDGFSFFTLYPKLWKFVFSDSFRDYEYLHDDIINESLKDFPQVIIIEPTYQDAPHIGSDRPNDNHAPLAIGWGEEFLRRTYESITANQRKWEQAAMILYYDEHGGFWDHVSPPQIEYKVEGNPGHTFTSTGPRIPGIIISPFVASGSVCKELFDHTSVLKFLAEIFTPDKPYSSEVERRKEFGSIGNSFNLAKPRKEIPKIPSGPLEVKTVLGRSIEKVPKNPLAQSFETAANNLLDTKKNDMREKYPELFQWKNSVDNARNT